MTQLKVLSDWWEGLLHYRDALKSYSLDNGALCVTMAGILLMLQLCVISWGTQGQLELLDQLLMELVVVHRGTAILTALVLSVT